MEDPLDFKTGVKCLEAYCEGFRSCEGLPGAPERLCRACEALVALIALGSSGGLDSTELKPHTKVLAGLIRTLLVSKHEMIRLKALELATVLCYQSSPIPRLLCRNGAQIIMASQFELRSAHRVAEDASYVRCFESFVSCDPTSVSTAVVAAVAAVACNYADVLAPDCQNLCKRMLRAGVPNATPALNVFFDILVAPAHACSVHSNVATLLTLLIHPHAQEYDADIDRRVSQLFVPLNGTLDAAPSESTTPQNASMKRRSLGSVQRQLKDVRQKHELLEVQKVKMERELQYMFVTDITQQEMEKAVQVREDLLREHNDLLTRLSACTQSEFSPTGEEGGTRDEYMAALSRVREDLQQADQRCRQLENQLMAIQGNKKVMEDKLHTINGDLECVTKEELNLEMELRDLRKNRMTGRDANSFLRRQDGLSDSRTDGAWDQVSSMNTENLAYYEFRRKFLETRKSERHDFSLFASHIGEGDRGSEFQIPDALKLAREVLQCMLGVLPGVFYLSRLESGIQLLVSNIITCPEYGLTKRILYELFFDLLGDDSLLKPKVQNRLLKRTVLHTDDSVTMGVGSAYLSESERLEASGIYRYRPHIHDQRGSSRGFSSLRPGRQKKKQANYDAVLSMLSPCHRTSSMFGPLAILSITHNPSFAVGSDGARYDLPLLNHLYIDELYVQSLGLERSYGHYTHNNLTSQTMIWILVVLANAGLVEALCWELLSPDSRSYGPALMLLTLYLGKCIQLLPRAYSAPIVSLATLMNFYVEGTVGRTFLQLQQDPMTLTRSAFLNYQTSVRSYAELYEATFKYGYFNQYAGKLSGSHQREAMHFFHTQEMTRTTHPTIGLQDGRTTHLEESDFRPHFYDLVKIYSCINNNHFATEMLRSRVIQSSLDMYNMRLDLLDQSFQKLFADLSLSANALRFTKDRLETTLTLDFYLSQLDPGLRKGKPTTYPLSWSWDAISALINHVSKEITADRHYGRTITLNPQVSAVFQTILRFMDSTLRISGRSKKRDVLGRGRGSSLSEVAQTLSGVESGGSTSELMTSQSTEFSGPEEHLSASQIRQTLTTPDFASSSARINVAQNPDMATDEVVAVWPSGQLWLFSLPVNDISIGIGNICLNLISLLLLTESGIALLQRSKLVHVLYYLLTDKASPLLANESSMTLISLSIIGVITASIPGLEYLASVQLKYLEPPMHGRAGTGNMGHGVSSAIYLPTSVTTGGQTLMDAILDLLNWGPPNIIQCLVLVLNYAPHTQHAEGLSAAQMLNSDERSCHSKLGYPTTPLPCMQARSFLEAALGSKVLGTRYFSTFHLACMIRQRHAFQRRLNVRCLCSACLQAFQSYGVDTDLYSIQLKTIFDVQWASELLVRQLGDNVSEVATCALIALEELCLEDDPRILTSLLRLDIPFQRLGSAGEILIAKIASTTDGINYLLERGILLPLLEHWKTLEPLMVWVSNLEVRCYESINTAKNRLSIQPYQMASVYPSDHAGSSVDYFQLDEMRCGNVFMPHQTWLGRNALGLYPHFKDIPRGYQTVFACNIHAAQAFDAGAGTTTQVRDTPHGMAPASAFFTNYMYRHSGHTYVDALRVSRHSSVYLRPCLLAELAKTTLGCSLIVTDPSIYHSIMTTLTGPVSERYSLRYRAALWGLALIAQSADGYEHIIMRTSLDPKQGYIMTDYYAAFDSQRLEDDTASVISINSRASSYCGELDPMPGIPISSVMNIGRSHPRGPQTGMFPFGTISRTPSFFIHSPQRDDDSNLALPLELLHNVAIYADSLLLKSHALYAISHCCENPQACLYFSGVLGWEVSELGGAGQMYSCLPPIRLFKAFMIMRRLSDSEAEALLLQPIREKDDRRRTRLFGGYCLQEGPLGTESTSSRSNLRAPRYANAIPSFRPQEDVADAYITKATNSSRLDLTADNLQTYLRDSIPILCEKTSLYDRYALKRRYVLLGLADEITPQLKVSRDRPPCNPGETCATFIRPTLRRADTFIRDTQTYVECGCIAGIAIDQRRPSAKLPVSEICREFMRKLPSDVCRDFFYDMDGDDYLETAASTLLAEGRKIARQNAKFCTSNSLSRLPTLRTSDQMSPYEREILSQVRTLLLPNEGAVRSAQKRLRELRTDPYVAQPRALTAQNERFFFGMLGLITTLPFRPEDRLLILQLCAVPTYNMLSELDGLRTCAEDLDKTGLI
ncbi:hypothetical protein GMRT_12072 [Giardia muris]|uniref:Rapamycin-insensitive companion of mTOR domain-containing protein n=1 Tax=Giardia muris TaxID=5742 RepID=A0A4Z1SPF9_GIAMU|nr:hypothetical protein GMRT_12072 [Giardia muris]|eukprot:TNJ27686.1 hypothetical protein GMRT_12072 [Giardia muris]